MIRILHLTFIYLIFKNTMSKPTEAAGYRCMRYEKNVDFKGDDISFTYNLKTPEDCEKICVLLKSVCKGFTFWKGEKTVCFIKNIVGEPKRWTSPDR